MVALFLPLAQLSLISESIRYLKSLDLPDSPITFPNQTLKHQIFDSTGGDVPLMDPSYEESKQKDQGSLNLNNNGYETNRANLKKLAQTVPILNTT